ncbi:MAG TPA: AAA family ATPase [Candidatus Acidoferrum sp.]|jgi:general secretion pathway protein A
MLLDFYNLEEQPFGVTPDPRYLYFSPTHREALASLLFSVSAGRGFATLIARPGMGKTTLLFDFLKMAQQSAKTVFLCQAQYSPRDFLRSLLADLDIEDDGVDYLRMHKKLNDCLLAEAKSGRQLVVVIDEAQDLDPSVLEVVRMLSNFETPQRKMMHLVLAGQPQLAQVLSSPSMVQLRQRISIVARLKPLTLDEAQIYIAHRLRVAGYSSTIPLFSKPAVELIAAHSEGIPRNINNICFNAMALACVLKQKLIGPDVVQEVLADLDLRSLCPGTEVHHEAITPTTPVAATVPLVSLLNPLPALLNDNRRSSSIFLNWARRSILAASLLALIAWPLLRANHEKPNLTAVEAQNPQPVSVQPAIPSLGSGLPNVPAADLLLVSQTNTVPAPPTMRTIIVQPNDSLYTICIQNFGAYNHAVLKQLLDANPDLDNPSLIQPGQEIHIPLKTDFSSADFSPAELSPMLVHEENKKP